jgi:hypothetical protein
MLVERLDFAQTGQVQRLDNGFLKLPLSATRAGIFVYKDQKGKEWRELRPVDEVFHQDSVNSLQGVPVTNTHPKEMVNASNAKQYTVGFTSDTVVRERNTLKTFATIMDKATIDEIDADSKREVSCGYMCDLEWKPGVFNGQHYDAIQRNIRYNHVAVVKKGRAGPDIRLHLDGQNEEVMRFDSYLEIDTDHADGQDNTPKGEIMKVLVIKGVEVKFDSDAAYNAVVAQMKADADQIEELKKSVEDAGKEKSQLQAKCDSVSEELTSTKAKLDDKAAFDARVNDRIKLITFASKKIDGDLTALSDDEIIVKLLQKRNPEFKADGKDTVYLRARLDHLMEEKEAGGAVEKMKQQAKDNARGDTQQPKTAAEVRAERMKRDSQAWTVNIGRTQK